MVSINRMIDDINLYLSKCFDENGFKGRSFYGEAFYAAGLALYDEEKNRDIIKTMLVAADKKNDIKNSTRHWEFNNYATLQIINQYPEYVKFLSHPMYYGKTKVSNWVFQRQLCKCLSGAEKYSMRFKAALKKNILDNGLILDDKLVSSFQYHCFSAIILYEIYQINNDKKLYTTFMNAVNFTEKFTLRNGESLYIGRGQEQIFGYGCLIYMYEIAYKETEDVKYLYLQQNVLELISDYCRINNCPSLVINECEVESELTLDMNDTKHLGWYSYNNYFDYLPFFNYFLIKTLKLKENRNQDIGCEKINYPCSFSYNDSAFVRYSNEKYDAVLASYYGKDPNYQLLPYIVFDKKGVMPCFGGEQSYGCVLYPSKSLPAPFLVLKNEYIGCLYSSKYLFRTIKYLRKHLALSKVFSIWENYEITIKKISETTYALCTDNSLFKYERIMQFCDSSIEIAENFVFKRKLYCTQLVTLNLAFFKCNKIENNLYDIGDSHKLKLIKMEPVNELHVEDWGYGAKGKFQNLVDAYEKIVVSKNMKFQYQYRILL